jgi:hypothetical protein
MLSKGDASKRLEAPKSKGMVGAVLWKILHSIVVTQRKWGGRYGAVRTSYEGIVS